MEDTDDAAEVVFEEEAEEAISMEGVSDIRRRESISRAKCSASVREAAPIVIPRCFSWRCG